MGKWKNFEETIKILDITEKEIIPFLEKGLLQPYIRPASPDEPPKPMPCPEIYHESNFLNDELKNIKDRIVELLKFREILKKVKENGYEKAKRYRLLILTILAIEKLVPVEKRTIILMEGDIEFNEKNTSWITENVLTKYEAQLNRQCKKIFKRNREIDKDDYYRTSWKYLQGPYLGDDDYHLVKNNKWPGGRKKWKEDLIDWFFIELKKSFFLDKDIENAKKLVQPNDLQNELHKKLEKWYDWDDDNNTLTFIGINEPPIKFTRKEAKIIRMFDEKAKNLKPGQEYAELLLDSIRKRLNDDRKKEKLEEDVHTYDKQDIKELFQTHKKDIHKFLRNVKRQGLYQFSPDIPHKK
jgi:hypothetical protein